jgi:transposase
MPGFGPLLAAEFLASTGADLSVYISADRLAGVAGLAPAPRDSGKISSNHHRPRRYDRRLLRACYLAAMVSVQQKTESRVFYDRKRSEGKSHKQAVLALARRRLDVIWAMFRDDRTYAPAPPERYASETTSSSAPQEPTMALAIGGLNP